MSTPNTPERPAVLHEISETQMQELEFQANEYDQEQFLDIAKSYGWDEETVKQVWAWFEVQNNYPIESMTEE